MTLRTQTVLNLPYSHLHPMELQHIELDESIGYYNDIDSSEDTIFIPTDTVDWYEDNNLFCLAELVKKAKELYDVEFIRFTDKATVCSNFTVYRKKNEI